MPTMQPTANLAKITIPTGYEQQQLAAASKRKLADAMLQQGLAPDPNMVSWTQMLGHLAQAWAGKSMQNDADKLDADVRSKILSDYNARRTGFLADSRTMDPQQLVEKYGNDPMLQNDLKPYEDAFAAGLKQNNELTSFGGRMVRKGDVVGQYANDPNKMIFVEPDGQTRLNPVAVTAAAVSSGNIVPTKGYAYEGRMPGANPNLVDTTGLNDNERAIMLQELARRKGLSAEARAYQQTNPLNPPPSGVVNGKPYWEIQGKFYDNPEGK